MLRALLARVFPPRSAGEQFDRAAAYFQELRRDEESADPRLEAWAAYRAGVVAETDEELGRPRTCAVTRGT